jgi:hypothetical protein
MVKIVLNHSGFKTALVAVGWLAFVCSFFTSEPISYDHNFQLGS